MRILLERNSFPQYVNESHLTFLKGSVEWLVMMHSTCSDEVFRTLIPSAVIRTQEFIYTRHDGRDRHMVVIKRYRKVDNADCNNK